MRGRFPIPEVFLGALLAVAIFGLGFAFRAYGPETNYESQQRAAEKAEKQNPESFWDVTITDALVAAFTGALFIVAVLQFRALRAANAVAEAAANAADASAQAEVFLNLPLVMIEKIRVECGQNSLGEHLFDLRDGRLPQQPCTLHITFRNVGKSRAIVSAVSVNYGVYEILPAEPQYKKTLRYTLIMNENDGRFFWVEPFQMTLSAEEIELGKTTGNLWVWGFIRFNDYMESTHEVGFLAQWEADGPGGFYEHQAAGYNYTDYDYNRRGSFSIG